MFHTWSWVAWLLAAAVPAFTLGNPLYLALVLGAAWLVKRTAGAIVPPLSLVRVVGAMAIAIAVARALPYGGKIATIGFSAVIGLLYLVLLIVSRELGKADLVTLKTVVTRRKA